MILRTSPKIAIVLDTRPRRKPMQTPCPSLVQA